MDRVPGCQSLLHSFVLVAFLAGCGDADDAAHDGPCPTTIATGAPATSGPAGSGASGEADDSGETDDWTTGAASTTSSGTTGTGGGETSSGGADETEGAGESGDSEPGETGPPNETTDAGSTGDPAPGDTGAPGETTDSSSTGDPGDTTGDGPAGPSFAADVWPLFADGCGCHQDNNGAGKLRLTSKDAYDNLVNVASDQLPSMPLVAPGDAANSYLWHKMDNTHKSVGGEGKKMPPGGLLDPSERALVQQWIDQGAQP